MPRTWTEWQVFLKSNAPWIFFILGIFILSAYIYLKASEPGQIVGQPVEENYISNALLAIATSLMSGGVFAAVLKSLQFSNVFGEELEKIIYNQRFLSEQKGIQRIWHNVSNALYTHAEIKNKLAHVCNENILDTYLGNKIEFFYEDSEHHFDVKMVDSKKSEIEVKFVHTMCVIASSTKEIELVPTSTQQTKAVQADTYTAEFYEITGKGKTRKEIKILPTRVRDNAGKGTKFDDEILVRNKIALSGKKKYFIKRVVKHRQNLSQDRTYKFTTKRHLKNLKVAVNSPEDLSVDFLTAGTLDEFDPGPNHKESAISVEYKDIIFPHQGYVLIFG